RQYAREPRRAWPAPAPLRQPDSGKPLGTLRAVARYIIVMRLHSAMLATALFVAAAAAHAQNPNLESIANDRYTRSHDYDLVHQRIVVRDFNWDSLSFTGSVASTLIALRPALDSVILDAGAPLDIKRVAGKRNATLRTSRPRV